MLPCLHFDSNVFCWWVTLTVKFRPECVAVFEVRAFKCPALTDMWAQIDAWLLQLFQPLWDIYLVTLCKSKTQRFCAAAETNRLKVNTESFWVDALKCYEGKIRQNRQRQTVKVFISTLSRFISKEWWSKQRDRQTDTHTDTHTHTHTDGQTDRETERQRDRSVAVIN